MKLFKSLAVVLLIGALLMTTSCSVWESIMGTFGSDTPDNSGNGNVVTHTHNPIYVEKTTPGYATYGYESHYKCECGKLFFDKEGTKRATLQSVTLRSETGFDKQTFTKDGYSLNYCVYEPEDLDKDKDLRPLVIFLHGAGERGSDNESQLKNAILKVVGDGKDNEWSKAVVVAPQCPSSTGGNTNSDVNDPNKWAETNWTQGNYLQDNLPESAPLHAVAELVKEYVASGYIDPTRVYVVGLSMGGFGTWDLISRYPELFAAAVPICGGGPSDKIDILKDIPIYAFHGSSDTVVPYAGSQGMYTAINNAGGKNIIFYTFAGAGHGIWDQAITFAGSGNSYPALESWLFSQSK